MRIVAGAVSVRQRTDVNHQPSLTRFALLLSLSSFLCDPLSFSTMEHPPEHHHHRSLSPSAIMDGLFSTSAAGPSATAPSKQSEFRASSPSHQSSGDSGAWTLPSILKQGRSGLSNVSVEQLQHCLQPVLAGLEQLDPETLLQLDRVQSGGARLRDGYVLQARD